jgi:DinB superfamily
MKKEIQAEISKALAELHEVFSRFEQEQVNVVPFEGSWTAGQLLRHMNMSNSGFVQLLNGTVSDTQRNPDELVETIKADLLDFTIKMQSPEAIQPPKIIYDKEKLLSSLKKIQEHLNQSIETLDLTKTCMDFELPVYGFLTRQ